MPVFFLFVRVFCWDKNERVLIDGVSPRFNGQTDKDFEMNYLLSGINLHDPF